NALGTNVLDSFEAVFSRGGERSLGYFRFPRNDFERGALADMVEQHLRTNVGEDQGRAQFLFLDALPIHAKHPAYHSLDFEIASVIDRVAEIPGLNVTVVLLGRRENIRRLREHKKVQAVTDFVKVDTCLDSASQLGLVRHALAAEQVYVSEDFI